MCSAPHARASTACLRTTRSDSRDGTAYRECHSAIFLRASRDPEGAGLPARSRRPVAVVVSGGSRIVRAQREQGTHARPLFTFRAKPPAYELA
jgi:hypothetical protein